MNGDIQIPPALYNHPFPGVVQRHQYLATQVEAECYRAGATVPLQACAILVGADICIVIMPWQGIGGVGLRTWALLDRHEQAHGNVATNEIFYALGGASVAAVATAGATQSPVLSPGGICVNVGPATYVAAVTATNPSVLRITQLSVCPPR
jgi:hypothetical protein